MQRSFQHSAEGSTWTKKNHKYIRKEGNRYIYPEDLKKGTRNSYKTGPIKQRSQESQKYKIGREEGIPDNGMIRMRQSGKRPVSIDYSKDYLDAMKSNSSDHATNQSIFNYDAAQKRQRRNEETEKFRRAGQANNAVKQKQVERKAKRDRDLEIQELQAMERRDRLNSQGSNTKGQEYAKISAPTGKKRAKRLAAEKEIRAKQRRASNNQGQGKGREYAQQQGKQAVGKLQNEKAKRDSLGIQTEQEFAVKNASNKLKKNGYFTMKNGKSVFVPSDEITMKKMSKAEKLVNKIKSKFSKKK